MVLRSGGTVLTSRRYKLDVSRSVVHDDDRKNGRPILSGTKVGVHQIHVILRDERVAVEDVAKGFPELDEEDVEVALTYYSNHQDEMAEIERKKKKIRQEMGKEGEVVDI